MQTAPSLSEAVSPPATRGSYKWWVVFMLWFVCFLNYADRQAISAIFPKLEQEFGFNKEQLGLIGSAFMWVYALGAPLAGYIGDRVRRKELILGGCVFWSLITVLTGRCVKLWQFVAVRASEGFGETFYFPASMSLISDYHGPQTRSKALSFHQSSVYIGTVAGTWVAAILAQHYGWRLGFYFFGSAGILLAIVLFAFLREPRRGMSESPPQSRTDRRGTANLPGGRGSCRAEASQCDDARLSGSLALPNAAVRDQVCDRPGNDRLPASELLTIVLAQPTAVLLMLAFLGANFVATIFLVWAPTFLVEKFHYTLATAGFSGTAFIHLSSAISAPLGGVLADALARRKAGGRMLVQAFGLLIGATFVFLVGATDRTGVLLISMTLFGFCKGLYDSNIFASLYDVIEPRARSTAAGFMNTIGWLGGALGPLYVGYFALHGAYGSQVANMSHAISLASGIYILSGLVLLAAARNSR